MRSDGEGEPHIHPGAIPLHRRVDELLDAGEIDDFIKLDADFGFGHAEDGAVEEDVFAAAEFRVESSANLEQRGDAASDSYLAAGRLCDAAQNLQQGTLASSIATDNSNNLARLDIKRDIAQGPEFRASRGIR